MKKIFIILIERYQNNKKSDHIESCIFYPSCSNYAILTLKKNNTIKALFIILKRIYRCDSAKNVGGEDYP